MALVSLECVADRAVVCVSDDGRGFSSGRVGPEQLGLRGMARRLEKLGGVLRVDSSTGHGTVVRAEVPL